MLNVGIHIGVVQHPDLLAVRQELLNGAGINGFIILIKFCLGINDHRDLISVIELQNYTEPPCVSRFNGFNHSIHLDVLPLLIPILGRVAPDNVSGIA